MLRLKSTKITTSTSTPAKNKVNNLLRLEVRDGLFCTNNLNQEAKFCVLRSFQKFGFRPSYCNLKTAKNNRQCMLVIA